VLFTLSASLLELVISALGYSTYPDDVTEEILSSMHPLKIKTVKSVKIPPVELGIDFLPLSRKSTIGYLNISICSRIVLPPSLLVLRPLPFFYVL